MLTFNPLRVRPVVAAVFLALTLNSQAQNDYKLGPDST